MNHIQCCERPRKTVSVSTKWGRRIICNSCGAPWKEDGHQRTLKEEVAKKVHTEEVIRRAAIEGAALQGKTPAPKEECDCHLHEKQVCDICAGHPTPKTNPIEDVVEFGELLTQCGVHDVKDRIDLIKFFEKARGRHRISVIEEVLLAVDNEINEWLEKPEETTKHILYRIRTTLQDMKNKV